VSWWRRAIGFVVPVLLAFVVMVAVWLEPVERWIAYSADWSRGMFPRGEFWSLTGDFSSGNLFTQLHRGGGWSAILHWFDATPWPAFVILMIATARWIAWAATWRVSAPREDSEGAMTRLRFGGFAESMTCIAWCTIGAVAWRFWWGLTWDGHYYGNPPFPTSDGPVATGLLWFGAALGYAWTIAVLDRRMARRDGGRRCPVCAYPFRGLDTGQSCPECGHDPEQPVGAGRRVASASRRWGPLAAAILLLAAPYLSTLLASLVSVLRGL